MAFEFLAELATGMMNVIFSVIGFAAEDANITAVTTFFGTYGMLVILLGSMVVVFAGFAAMFDPSTWGKLFKRR